MNDTPNPDALDRTGSPPAAGPSPAIPGSGKTISCRFKFLPHSIPPDELRDSFWSDLLKVALDRVVAALLAIPALPLILMAAAVVKLTSKGPAFYTQVRLGRRGRPYRLIKIRTMYADAELLTGARWSMPGDSRITKVGHVLRRAHIDELPQLWNVLRGDMSLVGPRPERPEIVPSLEEKIPGYSQRLAVRPGVTGLAQVQLPADTDMDSVRRKLAHDLYYIRRRNLWLDLRLILCTVFKVAGMSFRTQRRLFSLPEPEEVVKVSRVPLEEPATG